jgi:hypothetical protein
LEGKERSLTEKMDERTSGSRTERLEEGEGSGLGIVPSYAGDDARLSVASSATCAGRFQCSKRAARCAGNRQGMLCECSSRRASSSALRFRVVPRMLSCRVGVLSTEPVRASGDRLLRFSQARACAALSLFSSEVLPSGLRVVKHLPRTSCPIFTLALAAFHARRVPRARSGGGRRQPHPSLGSARAGCR